jgi:putative transposase
MPRRRRIEVPGGFYHAVTRGNNKQQVFDGPLRPLFLLMTNEVASEYGWIVYAWALMDNHYHLIFQLADGGLSDGMCELNTMFAHESNAHFGRINHCFGQRFWSAHLDSDRRLLAGIRYALWNPPRAGLCDHPRESSWTSYRATAGLDPAPKLLARASLLELFHADPLVAQRMFRRYVSDGRSRCQAPRKECDKRVT